MPALIETLPILPDLILNRLRQTPAQIQTAGRGHTGCYPDCGGALTLGLEPANTPGNSWLIISLSFFIAALFARDR